MNTVSKLIEVSREYKIPLCLTFTDLKKAIGTVETEAVLEDLENHGVPILYMKIPRGISQAERMLAEFDETCKRIVLLLNLDKTTPMRNGWVSDAPFTFNGANTSECSSYVYLSRKINMMNDLTSGRAKRKRAACEDTRASSMK
ncbi:hypothetical protein RB195_023912 [Necator americanus]|uniref:Uncharacterized protein n=1 Tax=Necator americanus TaxID=51031 RepID=A0ABR1EL33_NECAM